MIRLELTEEEAAELLVAMHSRQRYLGWPGREHWFAGLVIRKVQAAIVAAQEPTTPTPATTQEGGGE